MNEKESFPSSNPQSQTNSRRQDDGAIEKWCKASRLCDPTPEAYRIANEKARLRANDTRDPLYNLRQREYRRHLAALDKVKAVVDHSPPLVPKQIYHGLQRASNSTLFQAKIEVANAKLLYKLSAIYNGSVKTGLDTRLAPITRCIRNRTYERAMKTMELMYQNMQKFQNLQQTRSVYSNDKFHKWYVEQRKHRDRISKYPSIARPKICPLPYRKVMEKALAKPKQYAYLLIEIEDLQAENLVIELYADACPFTVKNFQRLCTNTKATACDCRTYRINNAKCHSCMNATCRCKKIDRLHCVQVLDGSFRKIYWIIGEHVDSTVEYTPMMLKESSPYGILNRISHTEAGLVTRPRNRSGGVFFITIGPCTHLDEFCYVFGRVIGKGMDFLKKMQDRNLEENGTPVISMHITDCGVVASPDEVPPPMLLQDFISQVRLEIMPFIRRNPERPGEWVGGKSAFADHLRQRVAESQQRFEDAKKEGEEIAEEYPDYGDADADDDGYDK